MKLLNAVRTFFNEREGNALETVPYHELQDGVMHNHNGFNVSGIELFLASTSYKGDFTPLMELYHYLFNRLVPEPSRLRLVYTSEPLDEATITEHRERLTAKEPQLRKLLEHRLDVLEAQCRNGELVQWRCFLLLRLGNDGVFDEAKLEERTRRSLSLRDQLTRQIRRMGFDAKAMDDDAVRDLVFDYLNPSLRGSKLGAYHKNGSFYSPKHVETYPEAAASTFRAQVCKEVVENSELQQISFSGGMFARMIALHTIPTPDTVAGMFHAVDEAGRNFYAIVDIYREPNEKLYDRIVSKNKYYESAMRAPTYVDPETVEMAASARAALGMVKANGEKFVRVSMALVLYGDDEDELKKRTSAMYSELTRIPGNPFMPLTMGVSAAFQAFAPFSGGEHDQKVVLPMSNAIHFWPTTGPWKGLYEDAQIMFRNTYFGVTGVNTFEPGGNFNVLWTGESGSGKSFGAGWALAEFLGDANNTAFIIDKGLGYKWLVGAADGSYADASKLCWNPFDLPPDQDTYTDDDVTDTLNVLLTMVPPSGGRLGDIERQLISAAIKRSYRFRQSRGVAGRPELTEDFMQVLRGLDELNGARLSPEHKSVKADLFISFGLFCKNGEYGRLFDGQSSINVYGKRLVYFDIGQVLQDKRLAPVAITAIMNYAKKFMVASSYPTVLLGDELRETMKASEELRSYVETLFATSRKHVAAFWGVSQNLSDFSDVMFNNCRFHFAFASGSSVKERKIWVDRWGLDETIADYCKNATQQPGEYSRALCFKKNGDAVVGDIVSVDPTPYDFWALTSEAWRVEQRDKAIAEAGDLFAAVDRGMLS